MVEGEGTPKKGSSCPRCASVYMKIISESVIPPYVPLYGYISFRKNG